MFLEPSNTSRDVFTHCDFIDFGFMDKGRLSEPKELVLENKFPFEVKINWALLKVEDKITGRMIDNCFRVTPVEAIIPAHSKFEF